MIKSKQIKLDQMCLCIHSTPRFPAYSKDMMLKFMESLRTANDYSSYRSTSASVLMLPHEIIAKILQHKYEKDHHQLKNVYHMIITCKEIYYNHIYLIYTLEPVIVSMVKYPTSISMESLKFLNKSGINHRVKSLDWSLTPRITTMKKCQETVMNCILDFPHLTKVYLSVNSLDLLSNLTKLPSSVTTLEINIATQVNPAWNLTDVAKELPKLNLQILKFKSFYPLSLKKYYYPIVRSTLVSKSPLYSWMAISDNIPSAHRNSPINQVCEILAMLIYNSKSTLQHLQIEKLHPVFLFRVMDTLFYPISFLKTPLSDFSDCNEFPKLKLLKVDNAYLLTNNLLLKFLGKHKEWLIVTDFMFVKEIIEVKIDEFQNLIKIVHHGNETLHKSIMGELSLGELRLRELSLGY